MKKLNVFICVMVVLLSLSGCSSVKGKGFVGHWTELNTAYPTTVDIEYDDGLYHIDANENSNEVTSPTKFRFEAKAESETVLMNKDLAISLRLLKNGKLAFGDYELSKSQ